MKTFEELGLSDEVLATLSKLGIKEPTEIQEKTIPLILAGRDVIGGSATGSGKTLAFASSMLDNLNKNGRVQALILTPTRELAEQVSTSINKFARYKKLNIVPVYGGVKIHIQIRKLQNADIVVGTPGRILDHLSRDTLNLGRVKFLVLDEVDRMFDMGFKEDVEKILEVCPRKRQTMFFSATISKEIDYLAEKYTHKPVEVSVKAHIDSSKLRQFYYDVPDGLKFSLLVHLLKNEKSNLIMIFCGTRRNVDFITNNLNHLGIKANAIHGGMLQNKRNSALNEFNSKKGVNVLVCTDVAARGLDIKGVSHVYNYDLPKTSVEYVHRIGRTARAGKEGMAISILCSRDYENFNSILRDDELKIELLKNPWFERVGIILGDKRNFKRSGRSFNSRSGKRESNTRKSSGGGGRKIARRSSGKSVRGRRDSRKPIRNDSRSHGGRSDNRRSGGNDGGRSRRRPGRNDSRSHGGRSDYGRSERNDGRRPRRNDGRSHRGRPGSNRQNNKGKRNFSRGRKGRR